MAYDRQNVIEETGDLLLETCSGITRSAEEWKRFLNTAVNVYKYKFPDQVLIYAQRPNASAVAEQSVWNKKMNRYLKSRAQRIALLKANPDKSTGLRYVFDIADTYAPGNARQRRMPAEWRITEANEPAAAQDIEAGQSSFPTAVRIRTESLAAEFAERSLKRMEAAGELSGELSHDERIEKFQKTVSRSAEYIVLARSGLNADAYVKPEDLEDIRDFGTYSEISVLGSAVSYMSELLIRQTERAVTDAEISQIRAEYDGMRRNGNIVTDRESAQRAVNALNNRKRSAQMSLFDMPEYEAQNAAQKDLTGTAKSNTPKTDITKQSEGLGQEIIDTVLRSGANSTKSVLDICAEYSKNKPAAQNIAFLKGHYDTGGKGFIINNSKIAVWWNDEGIRLARGESAQNRGQLVTWERAEERIREMLENGSYAPQETLDKLEETERMTAAKLFWYMHQDLDKEEFPELRDLFKQEWFSGGFPDSTAKISELLKTNEGVAEIYGVVKDLTERYAENPDIIRFKMYSPDKVLPLFEDLQLEHRHFTANAFREQTVKRFITEDEINKSFLRGSNFDQGKIRIYTYFEEHTDSKERINFLKEHYGTGGYGGGVFNEWHDAKGITLSRGDIASPQSTIKISWSQAEKRIDSLIKSGQYLTDRQIAEDIPQYKAERERERVIDNNRQYLEDMNKLAPEEKRGTLAKRISVFIDIAENYERNRFEEYGVENLLTESESGIADAIRDTDTRQKLADCMQKISGATVDALVRGCCHGFAEELRGLKSVDLQRVGDFYEVYGEQAVEVARVLDIALTKRRTENGNIPMAGVPAHALERYRQMLESSGYIVNVIDEKMRIAVDCINNRVPEIIRANNATDEMETLADDIATDIYDDKLAAMRTAMHTGYVGLTSLSDSMDYNDSVRIEKSDGGYSLSYKEYSRFYTDDEMVTLAVRAAQMWDNEEQAYQLNYHKQMIDHKTGGAAPDGKALSQSDFIVWSLNVLAEDKGIKRAHSDNDITKYFRRVRNTVDYELCSLADESRHMDGYGLKEIAPFFHEFVDNADMREQVYQLVADNLYDALSTVREGEISGESIDSITVVIQSSEHFALADMTNEMSYAFADKLIGELDKRYTGTGEYFETDFEVHATINGKSFEYEGSFEIGSGEGSLTAHIRASYEYYLSPDCPYTSEWKERGNAEYENIIEGLKYGLNELVPQLESSAELTAEESIQLDNIIKDITVAETAETETVETAENSLTFKIGFSEHPAFYYRDGDKFVDRNTDISFALGNKLLGALDEKQHKERDIKDYIGYYHKTDFEIHAVINGEEFNHSGRFDIGDGEGDLIAHIKAYFSYSLSPDNPLSNAWKNDEPDEYASRMADLEHAQSVLIPYLEQHTELTAEENRQFEAIMSEENSWFVQPGQEEVSEQEEAAAETTAETAENEPEITEKTLPESEQQESEPTDVHQEKTEEHTEGENSEENPDVADTPKEPEPETIEVGTRIKLDNMDFEVDSVSDGYVSLRDLSFEGNTGYPIFRRETEDFVREALKIQNKESVNAVETTEKVETTAKVQDKSAHQNFRITDDNLGIGTAGEKYSANIKAIKTLKQLEAEQREATPEEQEIMSRYVGWGGLAEYFKDTKNSELKSLLTDEEYSAARESVLSAFYTSPVIIKNIYNALSDMGLRSANILEPSCAIGNFFGLLPEEMSGSKLYGVELDSISGRIAQKLYPNADIRIQGFESTNFSDNLFDAVVGNIPFGQFSVPDKRYDKHKFLIHDYFIAKSIDKLRAGGIAAVVVPKGVMDKKNPSVRKYIAQRAELIGAVRLPNNAFKANAGTEASADILFLQKRDRAAEIEPDWVYLGKTEDGLTVNSYFAEHPEMVLGRLESGINMYGREDVLCVPYEDKSLGELLPEALKNLHAELTEYTVDEQEHEGVKVIPASPDVRNYSYAVIDGEIYFREDSIMTLKELPKATAERVKGMTELRDCMRELIDMQLGDATDDELQAQRSQLNQLYDTFTEKYGLINSTGNTRAFREDSSYPLLSSLENLDDDGKLKSKADIFTKRTIQRYTPTEHTDTSAEALAVSMGELARVDIPFMARLTGFTEEKIIADLRGIIYPNPVKRTENGYAYEMADEYLSGNVREKLSAAEFAAESNPIFADNVQALTAVIPPDLKPGEIDIKLGAPWLDTKYIDQFMYETLKTPPYIRHSIQSKYSPYTSEWKIEGKNMDSRGTMASVTYGTKRVDGYQLLENLLNLRETRVYDTVTDSEGKDRRVVNQKETTLARQKQDLLKQEFKNWIFKDPDRTADIVQTYNVLFNSIRPREYDGSHLIFPGMNPEITLRQHQLNAVAHTLYGKNTLLAHEVGAGKTFEMIASAMENKRLGLCHKSMFVVPNILTEQMGADILRLYPAANVLVASKNDFTKEKRRRLCARIATGDFDIVVIGHSQLEKIPISQERQERYLNDQIDEVTTAIAAAKLKSGQNFQIKQLEKMRRNLKTRLTKLTESPQRDDVVTFEELGIDRLYVDEAHGFKNLYFYTKMNNVAGLSQTEAQKSADLLMKCRYMDELTGGRGLIFATATPVSNSMTEIYTMMKYLQSDTLTKMGWQNFDAWAANFGETVTKSELAPEGTGYRERTRFAKFSNLPELMSVFKECADIKTADMLNLPVPKVNYHNVSAEPTEIQQDLVADLSKRAQEVHGGAVDPSVDNMLKITSDGRKIGLDQRLVDPEYPDEPGTKVNLCVENVFRIWEETADNQSTQLIFCDFSTPGGKGGFNIYDDIKEKLIARGVPAEEIAFIHDAKTDANKDLLFKKVRNGNVRVLIGSTSKCGTGMNVQDKLIALHDLDCPWRPADLQQRMGRIVRQGNTNPTVDIFRYVTKSTFDAYLWQTIENKQRFISQIMTSKSPVRSCEDADEATLSYAEIKALCAGDERIKEKMDLEIEVSKLKIAKANHTNEQFTLQKTIQISPSQIETAQQQLDGYTEDRNLARNAAEEAEITILDKKYTDYEEAGKAFNAAAAMVSIGETGKVGTYHGFDIMVQKPEEDAVLLGKPKLVLQNKMSYSYDLYIHGKSNVNWIISKVNSIAESGQECDRATVHLDSLKQKYAAAQEEYGKPFPYEAELNEKLNRLAELDKQLSMDKPEEAEKSDAEKTVAEKTVAEKTVAEKTVAEKTVAEKTVAEKTVAEKTVAEKMVVEKMDNEKTDSEKTAAENDTEKPVEKNTENQDKTTQKPQNAAEQRPSLRERLRQKQEIVAGQKSKHTERSEQRCS